MKIGCFNAKKLTDWGDSMVCGLKSLTRKRRKRDASKIRRRRTKQAINKELSA